MPALGERNSCRPCCLGRYRSGMASGRPELISPATRSAFRSLCTDIVLRVIQTAWENQGFAPVEPEDLRYEDSGARCTAFQLLCPGRGLV